MSAVMGVATSAARTSVAAPPQAADGDDRRRAARYRPTKLMRVTLGRSTGVLVDLSATGARVRHDAPALLHSHLRVRFDWKHERFEALALVLASRVVCMGDSGTRYESRVSFVSLTPTAQAVLGRTLEALEQSNLRRWVANLRGWWEATEAEESDDAQYAKTFIRYRLVGGHWERKITRDSWMPEEGFVVPAATHPAELLLLCRTYVGSTDGRDLVRLMARAVVRP